MRLNPVERTLLEYGRELQQEGAAQVGASFTGIPEADMLLETSPSAFLLGVLFTQGIPAERAWSGPYELQRRLGSLDLGLLAARPDLVRDAVQTHPMLHRFKEALPRWISSAAERVIEEYEGQPQRIWAAGSHVLDVTGRLLSFDGIGHKKAVMAVEILTRHFGVPLEGRDCGQVAYDVQVRRVFLRAGLIDRDERLAVEQAASRLCPEAPGTLDLPAWLIGRQSCRPRHPLCEQCRLGDVCPRQTWISVDGVGMRDGRRT